MKIIKTKIIPKFKISCFYYDNYELNKTSYNCSRVKEIEHISLDLAEIEFFKSGWNYFKQTGYVCKDCYQKNKENLEKGNF